MKFAFFFSLFSLIFIVPGAVLADSLPDEPHLVVEGTASVRVAPDTLEITLRISHLGRDVAEAMSSVEERSVRFLSLLKAVGVDRKDIGSSELFITPKYNWQKQEQVLVATEVSRRVQLTLRDLLRYADLMEAITKAEVGQIDRTTLGTSKEEELRRKALQGAMADARQKAELLAATFGEDEGDEGVGSVYSVTALSQGGVRSRAVQAFEQSGSRGSFEPGTIELSESVRVVYFIAR